MSKSSAPSDLATTGGWADRSPVVVLPSPGGDDAVCCVPLSQVPLTPEQAEQVAPLLKALGDPARTQALAGLGTLIGSPRV